MSTTTYTDADLQTMTRTELDGVATELGLDPATYSTKGDEIAAIEAAQSGTTTEPGTDVATTEPADVSLGEVAPFAGKDVRDIPGGPLETEHVLLTDESWVILGPDPAIPQALVGTPAAIIDAPTSTAFDDNGQPLYQYTDPSSAVTVRASVYGGIYVVPLSSFQSVKVAGGRAAVHPLA